MSGLSATLISYSYGMTVLQKIPIRGPGSSGKRTGAEAENVIGEKQSPQHMDGHSGM